MFDENKHPRDEKGQFTKAQTINSKFKKVGETSTVIQPKNDIFKGRDNYPQNISHYELIKEARKDYENSKVVEINLDLDIQKKFNNATPKERTKLAYKYIKDNLRGKYLTQNNIEVSIHDSSANKISHTLFEPKIRTTPQLAEIINKGKFVETKKANHSKFNRFIYYEVNIKLGNTNYSATINVGVNKQNECVLYDVNQFKEK